jgi:Flp pilus assembly protein TadG
MMKNFRNRFCKIKRDEEGATTVEFLIVMPLIIFWFAGTFTFFDA